MSTISTRILLKNDTLANWQKSSLQLKKGEVALALSGDQYLIKIGDGTRTWSQLPGWSNVSLSTTNVMGLKDFVAQNSQNTDYALSTIGTGANAVVKLVARDNSVESPVWVEVADSPSIPTGALENRLTSVESVVNTLSGDVSTTGSVKQQINTAVKSLTADITNADAGKTVKKVTQKDGVVSVEFQNLSVSTEHVSGLDTLSTYIRTTVEGQDGDLSTANTVAGAKKYAQVLVEGEAAARNTAVTSLSTSLSNTIKTDYVKYTDVKSAVTSGNKIVTESDIAKLEHVMHFKGTVTGDDPTKWAGSYEEGDVVINPTSGKEWVKTKDGWEVIGDQKTYATNAHVNDIATTLDQVSSDYTTSSEASAIAYTQVKALSDSLSTDLAAEITARTNNDAAISSAVDKKIYVDGVSATTLSVTHISQDAYHALVEAGTCDKNTVYVVSSENYNMYDKRITNLSTDVQVDTDAANVGYVKSVSSDLATKIQSLNTSSLSNVVINNVTATVANNVATFSFDTIDCGSAS